MTNSTIAAARPFRLLRAKAVGAFPAIVLLLCASLLAALETPSKPFLEKNSFYLRRPASVSRSPTMPPAERQCTRCRRIVSWFTTGNDVRYLYAEPNHCVCVFIGTAANYQDYRVSSPGRSMQPDNNVAPDYKTQASALLTGNATIGKSQSARHRRALTADVLLRRRGAGSHILVVPASSRDRYAAASRFCAVGVETFETQPRPVAMDPGSRPGRQRSVLKPRRK